MASDPRIGPYPAEIREQLERADTQLALYARDLRRTVDSERRKARELEEANARLAVLNGLKTDLLSFISHELRTPLNVMSAVDLLDPRADPEEQDAVVDLIRRGYDRLNNLVSKGLEYFDWLAMGSIATTTVVDLARVAHQAARAVPAAQVPEFDFQIVAPDSPPPVHAEEGDLVRVLVTFLDNAVKFSTEEKWIRVEVSAEADRVRCAVSDRGVGLSRDVLRDVFRPFTVADVDHHTIGTGLSLAIAKAIVEAHGGDVRAESPGRGRGATFFFELPAASIEKPEARGC